jgi:hypothetical protein
LWREAVNCRVDGFGEISKNATVHCIEVK